MELQGLKRVGLEVCFPLTTEDWLPVGLTPELAGIVGIRSLVRDSQ